MIHFKQCIEISRLWRLDLKKNVVTDNYLLQYDCLPCRLRAGHVALNHRI